MPTLWTSRGNWSLKLRNQPTKSNISAFRHTQAGNRAKSPREALARASVALVTHKIVHSAHLYRVSPDRDGSESHVLDQPFRHLRSRAKESSCVPYDAIPSSARRASPISLRSGS